MLRVTIDTSADVITFAGDTFPIKEEIKALGQARWVGESKMWKLTRSGLDESEVRAKFPNAVITEASEESSTPKRESIGSAAKKVSEATGAEEGLSVKQLSYSIRSALHAQFPSTVLVHGLLSSVKQSQRGFYFIDLVDEETRDEMLSCVIWRDADSILAPLRKLGFELEADLQVLFEVSVDYSVKRGSLSLVISRVIPEYTVGKLAAERDLTNKRLQKEKLFTKNQEKELPFLPKRLGIITSGGGTVINDFRASLDVAEFAFELFWCNTAVQGASAEKELLAAIKKLDSMELDAILLFRGGGSAADLSVFNKYPIARAICLANTCVVSAIGHQADQSSAQDVSHTALGVPKDIGRFFADIVLGHRAELEELSATIFTEARRLTEVRSEKLTAIARGIYSLLTARCESLSERLEDLAMRLPLVAQRGMNERLREAEHVAKSLVTMSNGLLALAEQRLSTLGERLGEKADSILREKNRELGFFEQLLREASPEVQLKRGYAIAKSLSGEKVLASAAQVRKEKEFRLQFADGEVDGKVEEEKS